MNAIGSSESLNEFYASLSADLRAELASHERVVSVPRGYKLLQYGVAPEQLVIVNSGRVEISVPSPENEVHLGTVGAGKVFGMRTLVSGEKPEINVTCLEECVIATIPAEEFAIVLRNNPQVYFAVAKVLSADLKIADQLIRACARRNYNSNRPRAYREV